MSQLWAAPYIWPNSTVFCIASGPSLTPEDVEQCRGRHTIVINDAYRLAPWADICYGADRAWWEHHRGLPGFTGRRVSALIEPHKTNLMLPGIDYLRITGRWGFDPDPGCLRHGGLSGYQGAHLAAHLGASRIVLLGYDMQPGPHGQRHFFGEHPAGVYFPTDYPTRRRDFATLVDALQARGVSVVNCSRVTALTCCPRVPLEEEVCASPFLSVTPST